MSTTKEYLRDPALSGETTITAILTEERPIVRTAGTWFHAQGGGQKADRGTIGQVEVYNVRHAPEGEVDHYVNSIAGLKVGATYPFVIDADWRRLNANYHSAGHLLAAVAEQMFVGIHAVNGHHWPGEARVEFEGQDLERVVARLEDLEEQINAAIRKGAGIRTLGDPLHDRKVQIGDFAPLPCGGTHATTTHEIGAIELRSAKVKGGVLRVGYDVRSTS